MNDFISQDERRIREERDRKKAEVRARLEAQAASKTKKKGFMTPERKKKLRLLLRKKAAEELKRQQEAKANERRKVISERTGSKKNFDAMSMEELKSICRSMHDRLSSLESSKWDLETSVGQKELEIHQLSTQVSDMRGKFVKPPLKRVPKYQAKIERMLLNARKEVGFTVTLKSVKKEQFKVDEPKDNKDLEPEWSWKKDKQANLSQSQLHLASSNTNTNRQLKSSQSNLSQSQSQTKSQRQTQQNVDSDEESGEEEEEEVEVDEDE